MKPLAKNVLAAKAAMVLAVVASPLAFTPAHAGIPVADGLNLSQTTVTALQQVAAVTKQIEQYRTQLQQYENMLQNTTAPAAYIWDQAQSTINKLTAATDTLSYYKQQAGSIDRYLDKFQDVSYYRSSPCFSATGCSAAEKAAMEENRRLASESQKKANDALFRGLDKQQDNLKADARTLERMQANAQGAQGQLEAIGYANQFASQQANQLLQIRAMLLAQQNAIAAKAAADQDQAARDQAMEGSMTKGTYNMPTPQNF
ncbi:MULTISPECIES: P-type conjugative transfer protein TrbJ [Xanthomonas]|uniref:P-type conjugative transfer protein TrbJ n=1 Tax=Xanthomonas hortorum pv. vitians TaxID=83224 RepID=A0AAW8ZSW2_9XANT|nr:MULTISPECIES: P-type conjugative transfer protein TrbJ [Xanthomonas]KGP23813.1 conjugal transfer protein TrbJ [Xanthomonas citri pv. fuscans]KGT57554.1 conjugal transfer protein TrbJ [Xanthomonas citri pv. fuscans]MDV7248940.1 P-type conjugative transfer protein TrbJ [Xanthomonas hortorum pv. vitians]